MHVSISSADLARLVIADKKTAVVLFSGEWCPDCREFKPRWEGWSGKQKGVYAVEVPRGGREWKEWRLDEIPTVAAFADGREVGRVHGIITTDDLKSLSSRLGRSP